MLKVDVCKFFKNQNFKLQVKFEINQGDFLAIFGKSGSGKTTLLRIIAGFEKAEGECEFNKQIFFNTEQFLSIQKRNIGFLFQDYALFENMNVEQNLLYAKNDKQAANELLELLNLSSHKNSSILELSGGQKQRVALARALMRKPKLLLLDEPLSALDNEMKIILQDYLLKIHKNYNITTILISHDVSEVYKLANKVIILDQGQIIKQGNPSEVFLQTKGSQKFAIKARILKLQKQDSIIVAILGIGTQITQVILSPLEAQNLKENDEVVLSQKAFGLNLSKININS
ncbi:ATP-binding cassette domain-containing protein [Campylobacter insulaenigrae]|uniref:ATP-binding cassette domain-containing protein n=1 Tax=Campylobacter insulaenigrae TaxID=260714 RepID=A0ABY3G650_9BACT|nr:ATP-binding cassette domain-containing protein [Campylobacter insulaenigrae]MCR6577169.1 ATP-binding cassette domain-containing protein [Campylobacter insulaenigrae]MCR6578652.1 ATP-binding cassette domain-containing protein [Campylobacter insulaenigrae]MCR6583292.1 ATP-binding cassette domain-containing protein [Campylobacter insulaenigrae]TWO27259.1 ATP-binding cassette domain-containing protein [Campylobacter insulaenigrae]